MDNFKRYVFLVIFSGILINLSACSPPAVRFNIDNYPPQSINEKIDNLSINVSVETKQKHYVKKSSVLSGMRSFFLTHANWFEINSDKKQAKTAELNLNLSVNRDGSSNLADLYAKASLSNKNRTPLSSFHAQMESQTKGRNDTQSREIENENLGILIAQKLLTELNKGPIVQIKQQRVIKQQKTEQNKQLLASHINNQKCALKNKNWIYTGQSCNRKLAHGTGSAFNINNQRKFEGQFNNGKLISGAITEDNKMLFDGKINNGLPHGQGVCFFNNEPEKCEMYKGKRIDAIYKQRQTQNRLAKNKGQLKQHGNASSTSSTAGNKLASCAAMIAKKKACDQIGGFGGMACMALLPGGHNCF